uniref:Uncharacterized protein n=1 Tax=Ananas comosus var. bracteatus TaxID=296719 RepID=A0A6V7P9V2_ANACO|nr:unnamed protein product [Ananas comosus var. bracteatus]
MEAKVETKEEEVVSPLLSSIRAAGVGGEDGGGEGGGAALVTVAESHGCDGGGDEGWRGKKRREISESSAEKKTHDLATPPRSTPSKRFSFSSVASSSTPRSSITQVSRHSFSDSTKRMMQPESPLAQSASAVSSPNRRNRTPSTGNNTANSMPRSRILTRSMSSISNSEGRTAPRSVSSRSEMKRGTESKPFLRRGSGIGAGAGAAIAKPRNCNVFETTANEEETTEMVDQCDIVSDREKDNNKDCPRLSGNDSGGKNSSLSQELYNDVEPVSGNGKANGNKVEELSGESSRSWYSNIIAEAELTRVRKKKREIAEKQIVASTNPQSPKDVARGLKRFLNFGRRSKGSEGLASECASALVNSHVDEDIEYEPNTVKNCPLNDLSKSKDGAFASDFNDQRNGLANSLEVHSLHSSVPTLAANFDQKEDHSLGKSPKAHRSFFSLPSFRSKGSETKLK